MSIRSLRIAFVWCDDPVMPSTTICIVVLYASQPTSVLACGPLIQAMRASGVNVLISPPAAAGPVRITGRH